MPAANVIQLRTLLAEKIPGLRMRLEAPHMAEYKFQAAGLRQIDEPLQGGFPKGAITEVIVAGAYYGSSTLLQSLVQQAAKANEILTLIDGNDSFDVTQLDEKMLSRLLWIRCRSVAQAIRAADLALRDGNLSWVILDLKSNSDQQLRKISPATWYRFQRLVEETGTACVIFTPRRMLAPARARINLRLQISLGAMECNPGGLQHQIKIEVSNSMRLGGNGIPPSTFK